MKNQRKHIRFPSENGTIAVITVASKKDVVGLVITEAQGGCSICVLRTSDVVSGDRCKITVGKVGPFLAEVAWVKHLDDEVSTIGIKFLE